MSVAIHSSWSLFTLALALPLLGCKEEAAPTAASSVAQPVASAPAATSAPAEIEKPPPPKPREDCPEGSSGIGSYDEPCLGSGATRMMEVVYTGKTTEQGPKFSVTNQTKRPILYGSVVVYFYDKAGKQLEVTVGGKAQSRLTCSGNIFAGHVKPEEKIYVFFSCVPASSVPEATATIEAEMQTVGFSDEEGTKNEFYWRNPDLVPEQRSKGGLKAEAKKK